MSNKKIIPITCTSADLVDIELLKPIQGELKQRTREQLYSLRSLIIKYGFSFPIFVWKENDTYFTLDGHGRDFVSRSLIEEGYLFEQKDGTVGKKVPVDYIEAVDRKEAKEKLLALNSSFGTITEEGLLSFLLEPGYELSLEDITESLSLPNIDFVHVENLINQTEVEEENKDYQFVFSQEQIMESIKKNFPEFKSVQEIINGVIDYPLAMHQFNRLCSGNKNVGGEISLLFNPHRFETKIKNRKYTIAEQFMTKEKGMLSSLSQWLSKQKDVVHHKEYIIKAKVGTGTQIAHEFKPYLARDIYLDHCEANPKVLDPCAGWGGRLIGFTSSQLGGEYWATDPSTKTYQGLLKLSEFLLTAENISHPEIKLFNSPFEDLQELPERYFDFAFTSPPYFDTEIYSDEETQAANRYKTLEEFNERFLTELIAKTVRHLKKGKCFLLNIGGNQIRFDKIVFDICDKLNLQVKEVFNYKIGKGDHFAQKYHGDKLENTIKANDLFFEIKE